MAGTHSPILSYAKQIDWTRSKNFRHNVFAKCTVSKPAEKGETVHGCGVMAISQLLSGPQKSITYQTLSEFTEESISGIIKMIEATYMTQNEKADKQWVSIQGNSGPVVLHKCLALATCIRSKSN